MGTLRRHAWPGNIRELRNVLTRAVVLCDGATLEPGHLRLGSSGPTARAANPEQGPLVRELEYLERSRVIEALGKTCGNQTYAARLLGISRRALIERIQKYGLPRPRKRPALPAE
jgi:DNA-binding NtrC family response regulator